MADQQRSSSSGSSTGRALLVIVISFTLVIGGCQKLEKNGTWDNLAQAIEK